MGTKSPPTSPLMNTEFTVAILAFVAFAIPIVGALWKIFVVREKLAFDIQRNVHRLELLEQRIDALVDQHTLAFNGVREVAEHVRSRSQGEEDKLKKRVADMERYLEKHTEFTVRNS